MGFFVKIQRTAICKLYSVGGHYGAVVTHLGRKGTQHCVLAESDTGVCRYSWQYLYALGEFVFCYRHKKAFVPITP